MLKTCISALILLAACTLPAQALPVLAGATILNGNHGGWFTEDGSGSALFNLFWVKSPGIFDYLPGDLPGGLPDGTLPLADGTHTFFIGGSVGPNNSDGFANDLHVYFAGVAGDFVITDVAGAPRGSLGSPTPPETLTVMLGDALVTISNFSWTSPRAGLDIVSPDSPIRDDITGDASGFFQVTVQTVPEPGSLALVALMGVAALRRWRRA